MLKDLFNENFDFGFKAMVYNNMVVATRAFEQFKMENEQFFNYEKKEVVMGHLLTYAIERQFLNSAFTPKAQFSVEVKQVNNYKYKTMYIETNDFILNIGRTGSPRKLLSTSKYKKELASRNIDFDSQLSFDFMNSDRVEVKNEKKYAMITYRYKLSDLRHLMIVVPSSDYKSIEYDANILESGNVYRNYVPEEVIEENIVHLREDIVKRNINKNI